MGSEKGGGMNAEQIKAAAERYQNPYPRASESGGIEYCSPWVHKQEWEDLHALANAMCERIAADAIQRTQHCPICEARSKADEPKIADLCMLVARLVQQVRRFDPTNNVAEKAMDYMRRKELGPSVLREIMEDMR
jgi:hypothetical protein